MKIISFNKHKLVIYESVEELPIKRFHKYNKFALIDSGVGSDVNDIVRNIERIKQHVSKDAKKEANTVLDNMREGLYLIHQEFSPRILSFIPFIHSINGKEIKDISDDNLKNIMEQFNDVSVKDIMVELNAVKKKIDHELALYFPEQFTRAVLKEYNLLLKKQRLLQLDTIMLKVDNSDEIENIDYKILNLFPPKSFSGKDSEELVHDKNFEDTCLLLEYKFNTDIQVMTVFKFYSALAMLKKLTPKTK